MPLLLALGPVVVQALLMLLKWWGNKTLTGEKQERFFNNLKEMAMLYNLKDLVSKWEADKKQDELGNAEWDRREAEKKDV